MGVLDTVFGLRSRRSITDDNIGGGAPLPPVPAPAAATGDKAELDAELARSNYLHGSYDRDGKPKPGLIQRALDAAAADVAGKVDAKGDPVLATIDNYLDKARTMAAAEGFQYDPAAFRSIFCNLSPTNNNQPPIRLSGYIFTDADYHKYEGDLNVHQAILGPVTFNPASVGMQGIFSDADHQDVTYDGMKTGEPALQLKDGKQYGTLTFKDIKGGEIRVGDGTRVTRMNVNGANAGLTLGANSVIGFIDAGPDMRDKDHPLNTQIVMLHAAAGATINGGNFDNTTLSMASQLQGTVWNNVTFNNAQLTDVQLDGATLNNATFKGNTVLTDVNFKGTTLNNVNFAANTVLTNASFENATLTKVNFQDVTMGSGPQNFRGARLTNVKFGALTSPDGKKNASLDLSGATLKDVDFSKDGGISNIIFDDKTVFTNVTYNGIAITKPQDLKALLQVNAGVGKQLQAALQQTDVALKQQKEAKEDTRDTGRKATDTLDVLNVALESFGKPGPEKKPTQETAPGQDQVASLSTPLGKTDNSFTLGGGTPKAQQDNAAGIVPGVVSGYNFLLAEFGTPNGKTDMTIASNRDALTSKVAAFNDRANTTPPPSSDRVRITFDPTHDGVTIERSPVPQTPQAREARNESHIRAAAPTGNA